MTDTPPVYGAPIALAAAKSIMEAAEAEARRNNWQVGIAILDSGGNLVLFARMENAPLASIEISQAKARTALYFRRPTKVFQDAVAAGGLGVRMLTAPNMTAMEGGIPILSGGAVIGSIGVSGVQSHEDAQIAEAGIKAVG
ncbi:MAG: heme-binding protein [Alphaproteobacteria bacterium]|nr:heme-binding protein [Alphaproteobacteria bacterium]MDE2012371.1 heme-binding protein [Alphaproteobacteria bacterium]MDE2075322.1 heme-binding protein [Alphaproteobacteria bacterium]MDE2351667.1 heme-binding protein [Alphaproteobacteria bacterium]